MALYYALSGGRALSQNFTLWHCGCCATYRIVLHCNGIWLEGCLGLQDGSAALLAGSKDQDVSDILLCRAAASQLSHVAAPFWLFA